MKKFLLSLLTVFAATSAFAATDTLTPASFGVSGAAYTTYKGYKSTETGVTYGTRTGMSGSNFQFNNSNKQKGSGIYSTANPNSKVIKSITIHGSGDTSDYSVYASITPYTDYTEARDASGDKINDVGHENPATFDISKGYLYFYVISNSGQVNPSSIDVEYVDEADPRTFVTLSFPEKQYEAFLGEGFTSPVLTCSDDGAMFAVIFTSSDETVATVDNQGNVTILDDGATTITASIPDDNDSYYGNAASYDLIVKDPNAIETVLNLDFFGKQTAYTLYTAEESDTKVEYTALYYNSNGMQMNPGNANGKGSGITVTATSPNFIISKIDIKYNNANGKGVNVYKKESAFTKQGKTTAINVTGATQVGGTVTANSTVVIGAPAFAIVPTGTVYIESVTVTYAKKVADDGSVLFETEAFKDYMICIDETVELNLPEDAPTVTYTSSNTEVADVEGNVIMALDYGKAEITASWDAVPGKWMAGSDKFTVYVKYATLADVLADALDSSTGFVHEDETYVGNFPVVVGSDNGNYNYVTDGTAWALFWVDHNHGEGAVLEAGWSGTFTVRNGLPEFTNIQHSDITDTTGDFTINTYDALTLDENVINEVCVLNDVTFDESTLISGTAFTGTYNGQEVTFYNQFDIDVVEAGTYNVKGAISTYKGNIQVYPIEYVAQEKTGNPSHIEAQLDVNGVVEFTNVEEGAHVYYRHGGENPDHTNVFTESAQQQVKRRAVDTSWTYNHTTHPLTYTGEELIVKYYAKAAGKAPSDVQALAIDNDGNTTSIVEISSVKDGEAVYDLMGRKVVAPVRGLYIQNGVKRVVR